MFLPGALKTHLTLLTHSFALCVVKAVYQNKLCLDNIINLQNINGNINGILKTSTNSLAFAILTQAE